MANSEWRTVSIDDIKASSKASIAIGPFGSRLKADSYLPSGVPVIRGNNLNGARFLTNEFVYVSDEKADELKSSIVYADDLVFPHRGNIGSVGLVPNNQPRHLLSTSLMKLTVNKKLVDPTFLFYYFTSDTGKHELLKNASQSGTPGIATPLSSLKSIKFQLPPLAEQRRIAQILGSLDDKIELNRQQNATLEQLARALFQSWFVDFDPVRAKASGESADSICRRLGLTPELLALFPAALEESVMGEIPAGWKSTNVGSLLTSTIGGDWGTDAPNEKHTEAARIIRGTDLPSLKSGNYSAPPARFVEAKKLVSRKLKVGDLVLEVSGGSKDQPTGRALYISKPLLKELGGVAVPASFCRLLRPDSEAVGLFLAQHLYLLYDQGKTWLYQNQSTGISNFQTTSFLERHLVALPSTSLVKRFLKSTAPMLSADALLENVTLTTLRDELLPKLLSGKMKLPTVN